MKTKWVNIVVEYRRSVYVGTRKGQKQKSDDASERPVRMSDRSNPRAESRGPINTVSARRCGSCVYRRFEV